MQPRPPLVSVIAISYNHEAYLIETLESITAQDFSNFEVIYCDDCSCDASADLATEWLNENIPDAITIINKENLGLCPTINRALETANGEYIQLISCDDLLMPEKLSLQVDRLDNAPENVGFVYSPAIPFGRGSDLRKNSAKQLYASGGDLNAELLFNKLISRNIICAPTALIRKSALDFVGPYDNSAAFEDYDMWLRLARSGFGCNFVDTPLVKYRIHNSNLTNQIGPVQVYGVLRKHADHPGMWIQLEQMLKTFYRRGTLTKEQRRDYRKFQQFHRTPLCNQGLAICRPLTFRFCELQRMVWSFLRRSVCRLLRPLAYIGQRFRK